MVSDKTFHFVRLFHALHKLVGAKAPKEAIVLFDGTDVTQWSAGNKPVGWKVADGELQEKALKYVLEGPVRPNELFAIPGGISSTAAGREKVYRWLTRIAGFKLKEAERHRHAKKRGRPERLDREPPAQQTSVAGRVGEGERARQIARAIAQLPETQGRAVRLRYLQGLTLAETALRLDRSEAAIKGLVSRGLSTLAHLMRSRSSGG